MDVQVTKPPSIKKRPKKLSRPGARCCTLIINKNIVKCGRVKCRRHGPRGPRGPRGPAGPPGPPPPCGMPSCRWVESPNDPCYSPSTQAYYQTVRYRADGFAPFGPFAFYKMWYDFASTGGIAVASSANGINWTFRAYVTGLISTSRHSRILFDPDGFGMGVPYRIWYWDSAYLYVDDATVLRMLRTANSVDGINWTNDTPLTQDTAPPLLTPFPAYNRGSYGPADVLYFPDNPPVLDPVKAFNNRYVMYYNITDGSTEQLALAVSVDGVFWRKAGPLAVLPTGSSGSWDENYATEHAVVLA